MATSVLDLLTQIYTAIGESSDPVKTAGLAGINWAQRAVAAAKELPEMRKEGELSLVASQTEYSLSSLTLLFDIKLAWYKASASASKEKLWFIPEDLLDVVVFDTSAYDRPFFYSRRGNLFIVDPAPSGSGRKAAISYTKHPAEVGEDDTLEVVNQDGLIVSAAIAITWAFIEEIENVNMWGQLNSSLQTALGGEELFLRAGEGISRFKQVEEVKG